MVNRKWSSARCGVGHSKEVYYLRFTIYDSRFHAHSSAPLRQA